MRAFYFVLAVVAVISEATSDAETNQNKLLKLVDSDEAISAGVVQGNVPRHLRGTDTKGNDGEEEDPDDEERVNVERLVSMFAKIDDKKLDDFFKLDDVVFSEKKLDDLINAKDLNKLLNTKTLDELLDVKKLDDLVDPKKLDVAATLDKKDSEGLAQYLTKNLFSDLKTRDIDPKILVRAMEKHGGFNNNLIEGITRSSVRRLRKLIDVTRL